MNSLKDTELIRTRLRFIDLIKSFFLEKPDAERISRWRGTFAALTQDTISPLLDQTARELSEQLSAKKLDTIQDEFYTLFVDPFSESHLNLMASHHLDGRNFGDTLIGLRELLKEAAIQKKSDVIESEDSLVVLFDILATLIEREKQGESTEHLQSKLINQFLIPYLEALQQACRNNEVADFYRSCIGFCAGYADLEKSILT